MAGATFPHTLSRLALLAVAAAGLIAALGCGGEGGDGDKTFDGDGYSFTYPGEWDEGEGGEAAAQTGEPESEAVFGPSEGANALSVQVYQSALAITEEITDEQTRALSEQMGALLQQADGRLTSELTRVTVDGLPGIRFEGSLVNAEGVPVRGRFTLVWDGRTQYFLDCEFTPERAEEMKKGCDQVLESFQVE